MNRLDHIFATIARDHLKIPIIATRHNDSRDFHNVAVWRVPAALQAAFDAGATSRDAATPSAPGLARFDDYEIHGVRKFDENDGHGGYCEQVPDDEAQFWSLFGHIPGQGLDCIGDFATRHHAEEIFARITGRRYTDCNNRRKAG